MTENYVATSTIEIDAPSDRVWSVLTGADTVKQYMFGADLVTDWTVGGPILWRGVWEGKEFEDKGVIVELEPERRLIYTHFSPLTGLPDIADNYHTLTWQLDGEGAVTRVTLAQDNNASAEEAERSQGMWDGALAQVKSLAEAR